MRVCSPRRKGWLDLLDECCGEHWRSWIQQCGHQRVLGLKHQRCSMPRQSSVSRDVQGLRDPKVKGTDTSGWEYNLRPGREETRCVPWTDTSFPAADRPFLYCGVSEGSCVAFKPVLVAWVLQVLEHANRVKGRKRPSGHHRAVLGQALFPKSITVTPLQSQALEFISFPSL